MNAKRKSILIIESDQGTQNLVRLYLKHLDAQFTIVQTWDDPTIAAIRAGTFELAIIDWKTRIQPAYDIYKMLRSIPALAQMPILFIAGRITRDDILHTASDPLTKFVVKPFTEDLLRKALREMNQKKLEAITKAPKTGNIQIHRGNGPENRDAFEIMRTGQQDSLELELYRGDGNATRSHAQPSLGLSPSGDASVSDVTKGDGNNPSAQEQQSLNYGRKGVGDASSFDYRLMQKLNNHGKPKGEAGIDVLIIDDDSTLTNLVQNHLSATKTDYVEVCRNSEEGWVALQRFAFQLIVLDWKCKGISGLALYNRIRSRPESRKTPVLILTGSIERESFRMIEDKNVTLVLEKPFELKVFEKAVDSTRRLAVSLRHGLHP